MMMMMMMDCALFGMRLPGFQLIIKDWSDAEFSRAGGKCERKQVCGAFQRRDVNVFSTDLPQQRERCRGHHPRTPHQPG